MDFRSIIAPSAAWMKAKTTCLCVVIVLLPMLEGRHPELTVHMLAAAPCQDRNLRLTSYLQSMKQESGQTLLPHSARNLDEFALEVKAALDSHPLDVRPVEYVFSDNAPFNPTCDGIWAEFGVATGTTVNMAGKFRKSKCSPACPSVHGFDTFTVVRSTETYLSAGLPEDWVVTSKATFQKNLFDQGGADGKFPAVEPNVNLIKGLFNESIPDFLEVMKRYAGSAGAISYLHVDCDLYNGSRDILTLLAHKLVVGTVILFDELVNYEFYKDHEMKALWEWLQASGAKLLPLGIFGPLPGKDYSVQLDWSEDPNRASHHYQQSAAFVIADIRAVNPMNSLT